MPKQTHCVVLLLFVLFVCAVTAVVAGYLFAEKPAKVVTDPRLEELFTSKDHQQLVKQLDKNSRSIVVGNRKDGLYPFLDSYLSRKITEGFLIKKRLFAPGEDLKWERFPWLAMGYHWLHGQFFSKEQLPTLWLIETRNILDVSDLGQLAAFAEAHPNHRFIVAANETRKGESFGFKKLQYTRPSDASLTKILSNEKLSKIIAKNIVKYHNSSLDFIADLMNTAKVQQVFQSYFSDEAEDIQQLLANSSKAAKLLKGLCKDGYNLLPITVSSSRRSFQMCCPGMEQSRMRTAHTTGRRSSTSTRTATPTESTAC